MHFKTLKMIATRLSNSTTCTKFVFGWDSAPDPAGGAHDAPPDPLVGWRGDIPSPFPTPFAGRRKQRAEESREEEGKKGKGRDREGRSTWL